MPTVLRKHISGPSLPHHPVLNTESLSQFDRIPDSWNQPEIGIKPDNTHQDNVGNLLEDNQAPDQEDADPHPPDLDQDYSFLHDITYD